MDRGGGVCLCLCLWCRCVSVASHSDRFTQVIHSHICKHEDQAVLEKNPSLSYAVLSWLC